MVTREFGPLELPAKLAYKSYDARRTDRVLWKIVRGLAYLETGVVIPEKTPHECFLFPTPEEVASSLAHKLWFPAIRNTQPMGDYGRVFEYKCIGVLGDAGKHEWKSGQAWGLLFWDQVIAVVFHHNPGCGCRVCVPQTA
jgi:hypothetical protein